MFVRKKRNRSGTTSVHIIEKTHGRFRVVHSFGSANDPDEIERLVRMAEEKLQAMECGKDRETYQGEHQQSGIQQVPKPER